LDLRSQTLFAAYSLAPVLEEIRERLLKWDHRLPAGSLAELRRVGPQDRHVGRAQARGILLGPDLGLRALKKNVEHFSDRPALSAPDVVRLPGLALVEREPVRADHVAHVGPVALAGEVTVVDHRLVLARLDERDLARERAGHEDEAPSRSGVIEAA